MKITTLPPQQEPEHITAKTQIHSLKEHARAFMNAHNLNGFQMDGDQQFGADTIGGILIELMVSKGIGVKEFTTMVERIRDISKVQLGGKKLATNRARLMVAKALGYDTVQAAFMTMNMRADRTIRNISGKDQNLKMYYTSPSIIPKPSAATIKHIWQSAEHPALISCGKPLESSEYFGRKMAFMEAV